MKILFVSALLPYPLVSGGQVRIFNLLKQLSKIHKITLLAFIRKEEENAYLTELSFLHRVKTVYRGKRLRLPYLISALGGQHSLLLASYDNHNMRDLIRSEMEAGWYDLVHIEPFYVAPSLPVVKVPLVIGTHNIEHTIYRRFAESSMLLFRPLLNREADVIRTEEESILRTASAITAVSDDDAKVIANEIGSIPVITVPNGVDPEFFTFKSDFFPKSHLRCLFFGNYSWVPNREAVETLLSHVWPKVVRIVPTARLTIAGENCPISIIRKADFLGVTVIKKVPDAGDLYRSHDILIAPHAIGGGSKYKILESMACGTLVVTTVQGITGLSVKPDIDVLVADDADGFARKISEIQSKRGQYIKMLKNARACIERNYTWGVLSDLLNNVWKNTATTK